MSVFTCSFLIFTVPPENVSVVFSTKIPKQDKPFTITCDADSHPPPEFQIFFNDTKLLANEMTYTIPKLNNSHSGFYKCIAKNKLDSRSSSARFLRVDMDGMFLIKPFLECSRQY